jgi:thiol:disulfide interchange protein DsbA
MGVGDKFHMPLFEALHVKKKRIWDEDALVSFAGEQGIDEAEFRKAYNSFAVAMKVRRAEEMGRRFGIDGVPTVIVNGKYRTSPSQVGSRDKLLAVVDHLIAVEGGKKVAGEPAPGGDQAAAPPDSGPAPVPGS